MKACKSNSVLISAYHMWIKLTSGENPKNWKYFVNKLTSGPVVVPVAKKHAGLATLFPCFSSGPFNKVQTVVIVCLAVAFEPKMYVCEDRSLLE